MKFNLLLHDKNFLPKKSKHNHKNKFEKILMSDLSSDYKILKKLVKD